MLRISVVMSVYAEPIDWIKQSVESILCQTFGDYEFIIVNDKPDRDDLRELLDDYSKIDSRIFIISNEVNIGLTKSLNKALNISKGKYIARMDADDYSHPKRFEKQVAFLDSHSDVVMVGCYARIMNEYGRIIGEMHTSDDYKYLKTMIPFDQPVYHPAMMYRRVINGIPIRYNEEMRVSQDYELCSRLIDYPLSNIPEYLLDYRMSAKQMTQVNKTNYIIKDAPIRKRLLHRYYSDVSEQDADSFISMYYLQPINKTQITDIENFIKHFYCNNKNNKNVYIESAMTFILVRYIKYLNTNGSLFFILRNFININKKLGNKFYGRVISHLSKKIGTKLKYKIIRKNVQFR